MNHAIDCPLSVRQHEVMLLVMRGLTYKQAARELGITHSTARTHMHTAYVRLGVSDKGQACMVMIRNGWAAPRDLIPDYAGLPYTTSPRRQVTTLAPWLPSPAQRLYLDAFDVLLRERTDEAADRVDFMFGVMCRERRCADRRRGAQDIDDMLLRVAIGVRRPIPRAA
jgi:DNA-binding CsgD family transcriptional regulator